LPAFPDLSIDPVTGTIGRRPSGARLYHRGSRFGPPARRKLDRNLIARIIFSAEALDRRTRGKGQHGGVLKAKGLDVLRALLRRFYSHATGECYPSYDAIVEAAGCCRNTVRRALRALEGVGIIETARRKVVASFKRGRCRFDVAVQDSNSYVFNFAWGDRAAHGDLALTLFRETAEGKFCPETSQEIKNTMSPALAAVLERLEHAIHRRENTD
jgi:predicted RNA binding protein with dsRBD fold (UPF0201 family)